MWKSMQPKDDLSTSNILTENPYSLGCESLLQRWGHATGGVLVLDGWRWCCMHHLYASKAQGAPRYHHQSHRRPNAPPPPLQSPQLRWKRKQKTPALFLLSCYFLTTYQYIPITKVCYVGWFNGGGVAAAAARQAKTTASALRWPHQPQQQCLAPLSVWRRDWIKFSKHVYFVYFLFAVLVYMRAV